MPVAAAVAIATGVGSTIAAHETGSAAKSAATTTSNAATQSAQIQADAATKAAQLQSQSAADALNYSRQQSQLSLDQYNQQQTRLQPYRNLGNFALGLPNDPNPAPLSLPTLPSSQTTPSTGTTASGQDPVQSFMLGLLNQGVSPQQVADQTNAKFGSSLGTGAKYYADSNTIGLPGFYVAGPQSGQSGNVWNVVNRNGGASGGTTTAATPQQKVQLNYTPSNIAPTTTAPTTPQTAAPPPFAGTLQAPQIQYRSLAQIGGAQ